MIDALLHMLRQGATWVVGRGAIYLALAAVSFAFGGAEMSELGKLALASVAVPLGGLLSYRLVDQAFHKRNHDIAKEFAPEVGALLGVDPHLVTIDQVKMVAEGNEKIGLKGNPVIRSAFEKIRKTHNMTLYSRIAAVAMTLPIIWLLGSAGGAVLEPLAQTIESAVGSVLGLTFKPVAHLLFSGGVYSLANYASEHAFYDYGGVNQKTAHDYIQQLEQDIKRGHRVTLDRVFGALVMCNDTLAGAIREAYGAEFPVLPMPVKIDAMQRFGDMALLSSLAQDISNQQIRPQELAFIAQGERSGVPRLAEPPKTTREKWHQRYEDAKKSVRRQFVWSEPQIGGVITEKQLREATQGVAREQAGAKVHATAESVLPIPPELRFVEKYATPRQSAASYVAREQARREVSASVMLSPAV